MASRKKKKSRSSRGKKTRMQSTPQPQLKQSPAPEAPAPSLSYHLAPSSGAADSLTLARNGTGPEAVFQLLPRGASADLTTLPVTLAPGMLLRWRPEDSAPLSPVCGLLLARFALAAPQDRVDGAQLFIARGFFGMQVMVRWQGDGLILIAGGGKTRMALPEGPDVTLALAIYDDGRWMNLQADGLVVHHRQATPPVAPGTADLRAGADRSLELQALALHMLNQTDPQGIERALRRAYHEIAGAPAPEIPAGAPVLIHFNGEALALGPRVSPDQAPAQLAWGRAALRMIAGLSCGDPPRAMELPGPGALPLAPDTAHGALAPVEQIRRAPPALAMAQALALDDAGGSGLITLSGAPCDGARLADLDAPEGAYAGNMAQVMAQTATALQQDHIQPQEVVYLWNQGVADRDLPQGAYGAGLAQHWQRIRADLQARYPDAQLRILLMQSAGSDQSHAPRAPLHVAADQLDFVTSTPEAHLVTPLYPFRLHDHQHPDLLSTRLMGEMAAWALEELRAGKGWTIAPPELARVEGTRVTLRFALREDEQLAAHDAQKYAGGIDDFLGFEAEGAAITGVVLEGRDLHLECDAAPRAIRYAMQRQNLRALPDNHYSARRGLLRTSLHRPARTAPQEQLYRFVPSFALSLAPSEA